jgi:hypothetical protein
MICIKNKDREERKDENTGGGATSFENKVEEIK